MTRVGVLFIGKSRAAPDSAVEAAWKARDEMAGRIYGPLPHEKRAEMYRFLIGEIQRVSPQTPHSICLESPEMWREIGPLMGQEPDAYSCCCGGFCTPGQPTMLPRHISQHPARRE